MGVRKIIIPKGFDQDIVGGIIFMTLHKGVTRCVVPTVTFMTAKSWIHARRKMDKPSVAAENAFSVINDLPRMNG